MMLKRLSLRGFRSFDKLDLALYPLNVLVGPNASGKSNLLDFFALLSEAAEGRLYDGLLERGGLPALFWASGDHEIAWDLKAVPTKPEDERVAPLRGEPVEPLEYHVTLRAMGNVPTVMVERLTKEDLVLLEAADGAVNYFNEKTKEVERWDMPPDRGRELNLFRIRSRDLPTVSRFLDYLAGWSLHLAFDTRPNAPMRQAQLIRPETRLKSGGENLISVLHHLSNRAQFQDHYEEILETLRQAFPTFDRLLFPSEVGVGKVTLSWLDRRFPQHEFPVEQLSDGVLRFLCLTTLLLEPEPPPLICIDEPEIGLHPAMLRIVAGLLHDASQRTQLIVTTHSPELIDHLGDPGDVVVMETDEERGASQARRLSSEELKYWLRDYSLGTVWQMNVFGGRP